MSYLFVIVVRQKKAVKENKRPIRGANLSEREESTAQCC